MSQFQVGDRVSTPAGNVGTVQPPTFSNPLYSLISIDNGATIWIRNDILKPSNVPDSAMLGNAKGNGGRRGSAHRIEASKSVNLS